MKKLTWKNETRKLKELIPYEGNPMIISDPMFEKLVGAIDKLGFTVPFVINTDNVIIAGHSRRKALLDLGFTGEEEVPVRVPNRKLDESEFKEANIGDNRFRGTFDAGLLTKNFDPDLLLSMGFQKWELGNLNNDLLSTMNTFGQRPEQPGLSEDRSVLTDADLPPDPGKDQPPVPEEQTEGVMAFEVMLKISTRRSVFELLKKIREEYNIESVSTAFQMIVATVNKASTHADFQDIFHK